MQILSDIKDAADAGQEAPFYADDKKIAETVMDFLFASQDASTASLVWTITLMAEHPDVLARVRQAAWRRQCVGDMVTSASDTQLKGGQGHRRRS